MKYYRVLADNQGYADAWFLGAPRAIDGKPIESWDFTFGRPYIGPSPAFVAIQKQGRPAAFALGSFDMPVVSRGVAERLSRVCPTDFERYPVTIDENVQGFEIINAIHAVRCVDESRAKTRKWGPDDMRQDKLGQYIEIDPLLIDPRKVEGRHLFRIWGYDVALIASDEVKQSLTDICDLGVVFKPVC
jgi:hypothetical protein